MLKLQLDFNTIKPYKHINPPSTPLPPTQRSQILMPPNLPLRNRPDPAQCQVDRNGNDADDPKHLAIVLAVVTEDDGEDNAAEVACGTRAAGDDALVVC